MKNRKHVCLMSGFVSISQFLPEMPEFLYATFDSVDKHCPVFFSPFSGCPDKSFWSYERHDDVHHCHQVPIQNVIHGVIIYKNQLNIQLRRRSRGGEMGEFSPPFFWAPLQSCWCTDLKHLNQALVLLHYYKNAPPIVKIRSINSREGVYLFVEGQG